MKAHLDPKLTFEHQMSEWRKGYEKVKTKGSRKYPVTVHGYRAYECPKCGKIFKLHLEKGVEDIPPEIIEWCEEAKALRDKAKTIPGLTADLLVPDPEDYHLRCPDQFICPICADTAESMDELGIARHILEGSEYEEAEYYEISEGNYFAASYVLGQGVPIILNDGDFENRDAFLFSMSVNKAVKEASQYDVKDFTVPVSPDYIPLGEVGAQNVGSIGYVMGAESVNPVAFDPTQPPSVPVTPDIGVLAKEIERGIQDGLNAKRS